MNPFHLGVCFCFYLQILRKPKQTNKQKRHLKIAVCVTGRNSSYHVCAPCRFLTLYIIGWLYYTGVSLLVWYGFVGGPFQNHYHSKIWVHKILFCYKTLQQNIVLWVLTPYFNNSDYTLKGSYVRHVHWAPHTFHLKVKSAFQLF